MKNVRIGIAQFSPVAFNLRASLEKLQQIIVSAVKEKIDLLVMGETWLCGYPAWLDHCPNIGRWDDPRMKDVFLKIHKNSVTIPGPEIDFICRLSHKHALTICIGVNEKIRSGPGNGTIYNSMVLIGPNGELLNHHRKLIPTFTEKLLYGYGDAAGLKAVDTPYARIGGSICWEHWMPLCRQSLHDSGEDIHIALWPGMNRLHEVATCHYAIEGRCHVIAACQVGTVEDFPKELELPEHLKGNPKELVLRGGSCVVGPDGEFLTRPLFDQEALIVCELDLTKNIRERMTLDTSGHYQRRDIFNFTFDNNRS